MQKTTKNTQQAVAGLGTDGRLHKIRTWVSPPSPSGNFDKAREQHHQGTGQWFLDSEAYNKWKTERSKFLWPDGIPGCSKTILSSSVVADLQKSATSPDLVHFYFDYNDIAKQSSKIAFRPLSAQLYHNQKDPPGEADDLYSSCNDRNR